MTEGSFDWRTYLTKPEFQAAPVSSFKHVGLSRFWDSITAGVIVEVKSPDCTACATPCCYWVASVISVKGYLCLLRYEGYDLDSSQDQWINLCTESHLHPVGWCAENGMPLVPPKCIEEKHTDWKEYLVRRLSRIRTIPPDFATKLEQHKYKVIKTGMQLEVVDKNLISCVRAATVSEVIGGRLHVKYNGLEEEDEGFWCHERSPLIHPIGWSQIVGHRLKGNNEYARQSLIKTLYRTYEPSEATWDMFVPVPNPLKNFKFQPEMKLEAIDPLNLSTICVATVKEVLRNNYLMIGIDGVVDSDGSDSFCYHASSPCIFPPGFCEGNGLELSPPKGYRGEFQWTDYLKKTNSTPAPSILFHREVPHHGFTEGCFVEAVDLMEPRMICVATVTKVVGRLLKVHFEGWEDTFDQWCDCHSPDLFPVGWCQAVGYRLEPPRIQGSVPAEANKTTKKAPRRRNKRKLFSTQKKKQNYETVTVKIEPDSDSYHS